MSAELHRHPAQAEHERRETVRYLAGVMARLVEETGHRDARELAAAMRLHAGQLDLLADHADANSLPRTLCGFEAGGRSCEPDALFIDAFNTALRAGGGIPLDRLVVVLRRIADDFEACVAAGRTPRAEVEPDG